MAAYLFVLIKFIIYYFYHKNKIGYHMNRIINSPIFSIVKVLFIAFTGIIGLIIYCEYIFIPVSSSPQEKELFEFILKLAFICKDILLIFLHPLSISIILILCFFIARRKE